VLNHLNFGGYLMWARGEPVFIDGRLEVVGEQFFQEYLRTLASAEALEAAVERYRIDWIIFPYRLRPDLLRTLSVDRRWRLAYVDHLATVFVRAAGQPVVPDETARLAEHPTDGPLDIGGLPGLGGPERPRSVRRWVSGLHRRPTSPTLAANLGIFHFFRGEASPAAARFAEAIRESDGAFSEIYENLGAALHALGRRTEAAACYRIALSGLPFYRTERRRRVRDRLTELEGAPRAAAGRPEAWTWTPSRSFAVI
jgi:tetratricopeptide (TPR) repeat protein